MLGGIKINCHEGSQADFESAVYMLYQHSLDRQVKQQPRMRLLIRLVDGSVCHTHSVRMVGSDTLGVQINQGEERIPVVELDYIRIMKL